MESYRVLLLAQSPVLRMGIRSILESAISIEHVVECGNTLDAAPLLDAATPDIVVIQDALPGVTGRVAATMIRQLRPSATIVVLTDSLHDSSMTDSISQDGADLLLPAEIEPVRFVEEVVRRLGRRHAAPSLPLSHIPPIEIAILDGMVRGLTSAQIAEHLMIAESAVQNHQTALLGRLEAVDLTSAVVQAVREGFVDLSVQLPEAVVRGEQDLSSAA